MTEDKKCLFEGYGTNVNPEQNPNPPNPPNPVPPPTPGEINITFSPNMTMSCEVQAQVFLFIPIFPPNVFIELANSYDFNVQVYPTIIVDPNLSIKIENGIYIDGGGSPAPEGSTVEVLYQKPCNLYSSVRVGFRQEDDAFTEMVADMISYKAAEIFVDNRFHIVGVEGHERGNGYNNTAKRLNLHKEYRSWYFRFFTYGLNEKFQVTNIAQPYHEGSGGSICEGQDEHAFYNQRQNFQDWVDIQDIADLADTNIPFERIYRQHMSLTQDPIGTESIIVDDGSCRGVCQPLKYVAPTPHPPGPIAPPITPNDIMMMGEHFAITGITYQLFDFSALFNATNGTTISEGAFALAFRMFSTGTIIVEKLSFPKDTIVGYKSTDHTYMYNEWMRGNKEPLRESIWQRVLEIPAQRCYLPQMDMDFSKGNVDFSLIKNQGWFIEPNATPVSYSIPKTQFVARCDGYKLERPLILPAGTCWRTRLIFDPHSFVQMAKVFGANTISISGGFVPYLLRACKLQIQLSGVQTGLAWFNGVPQPRP